MDTTRKFFGTYSGFVASVDDFTEVASLDNNEGKNYSFQKVKVIVPGVDVLDADISLLPIACVKYNRANGLHGDFNPLLPFDSVLVEFIEGDPTRRIVTGMTHSSYNIPAIFKTSYPNREGFVSRKGHTLCFDNTIRDSILKSMILLFSIGGTTIRMRDFYKTLEHTIISGARLILRGEETDSDDDSPSNVGVLLEGNPDKSVTPSQNYSIKFDEETKELEIKSREGYTVTLRDTDASGGSVQKGITVKTQTGREIVIDEQDGKVYIRNTGEIHLAGSKLVVDSDLEVNGKIDATDNISTLGEVFDTYLGAPSNLSQHDHTLPPPGGTTIPPRTP